MKKALAFIIGLLLAPLAALGAAALTDPVRPSIVLFLADDLGWADVPWRASPCKLPHLDRLAREGVRLEAHYVHPMCSPTRTACPGPTDHPILTRQIRVAGNARPPQAESRPDASGGEVRVVK